jgi:sigma-E factor negative regulatory protein RseA
MKTKLSALFDGEAEDHEGPPVFAALKSKESLRDDWACFQLIGDALRNEAAVSSELTPRVMRALSDVPVVLAPISRRRPQPRPLLAVAASVAGVAVVGWLAVAPQLPTHDATTVVRAEVARSARMDQIPVVARVTPTAPAANGRDMHEYLVAHQANASGFQLAGATGNIRTVSAVGAAE